MWLDTICSMILDARDGKRLRSVFFRINFGALLPRMLYQAYIHKARGGICGKFPRSPSMNTLSYCSRKPSALELSKEHMQLFNTKAEIPHDSVQISFSMTKHV